MKGWTAILALALAGVALAGCSDTPATVETPAQAPVDMVPEEDLFYLHTGGLSGHGHMDRGPDGSSDAPAGWGFASGGEPCERPSPLPVVGGPGANPCFGEVYTTDEALASAHAKGDAARVVVWLTSPAGPAASFKLEAILMTDNGTELARGVSVQRAAPASVPYEGEECGDWTVDLVLAGDLAPGQLVSLAVKADGAYAIACRGGGTDGSRLDLRPAVPATLPGAAS